MHTFALYFVAAALKKNWQQVEKQKKKQEFVQLIHFFPTKIKP